MPARELGHEDMEPTRLVTIGTLSERTEVNIETIRYYERIGILAKPPRSGGGHRLYAKEYQQRLVFVRRARELGFSLDEVRALLRLTGRHGTCAKVKTIAEQHITDIRRRIIELNRLKRALSALVAQCRGEETQECPILDALAAPAERR
jgi:MerR family transcriptional regulator, mercuric resistance operon regulatory protein